MSSPKAVEKTESTKTAVSTSYCQWSVLPNDAFLPSGPKRPILDAGVYTVAMTDAGPMFSKAKVVTDDLIELDDELSLRVLRNMETFWASKNEYAKRHIVYKRGLLLEGPAGSGKTSLVNLLTQELVRRDGIVIITSRPTVVADALEALRRIEPDRNVIVIFEDIDELIDHNGEHELLALLDGEHQIDNVVNIATTNFPEKLGARICNRPSRFDERIRVGMPDAKARERYLIHILKQEVPAVPHSEIEKWVKDTDGFSVAHLRELAVAITCLKQDYPTVLKRLRSMMTKPTAIEEFAKKHGVSGFRVELVTEEPIEDANAACGYEVPSSNYGAFKAKR
jgi:energy-coupling factor transporter ATP-binding protein EcfA2